MKLLILAATLIVAINANLSAFEQWTSFKATHNKFYNVIEDKLRFAVFQENLRKIDAHNAKYEKGEETYYMAVNKFADWSSAEFQAMLDRQMANKPKQSFIAKHVVDPNVQAVEEVDWRESAVLGVKDQGQCGSCWAFSTTGSLEGQLAIHKNQRVPLSEQELVDCDKVNDGCDGGLMTDAFFYIEHHGLSSEEQYPYTGVDGHCNHVKDKQVSSISGYVELDETESALADALANVGPVSIAVEADTWQFYSGGVFNNKNCGDALNHGVLAVGYTKDVFIVKNSWGTGWEGHIEKAHVSDFQFENQRRTFTSYGYALDPSISNDGDGHLKVVGSTEEGKNVESVKTVFETSKIRPLDKRKRKRNDNPGDIEGFLGPWGGFVDEQKVSRPTEEEQAELDEITSKKNKKGKPTEDKPIEEKSVLHIKDPVDYQGRSFLHAPQDVGVNLKSDTPPEKCFLPKSHIHTWTGHSKGVAAIRWFPRTAHLFLSASMDCRIKIWEVYNERRCIRTYYGHRQAVRDINFNNSGKLFLSAGYDRYIKLWDTETGQVVSRFTSRKIPYCVKFNPDKNKQHLFVAGTSDKKIICWDTRSGDIVQEYDRHLGAVNSITFVDENRRFVTTSDDKSLRVWEWDIPVDMKYIADPTMHSMPAVTPAPNGKWLACQSMDNKIVIFSAMNRFKINRKKTFTGHMVAGYACSLDYSPDMSYLVSGDADGKVYVWDWKTTKLYKKWKAHDNVCISVLWHPHEASKMISAGWDGVIKFWD